MQDPDFDFKDLLPDADCDMFCAIADACIHAMEEGPCPSLRKEAKVATTYGKRTF